MTKIYAIRDENNKVVTHVTLMKYQYEPKKIALVECDKNGKKIIAGYIAFISSRGLQRIKHLSSKSAFPRGYDNMINELTPV